MTGRALARSLAPLPEESLRGFLLRLSYRLNLPPSRVAHLCGLVTAQRRVPAGYLAGLPEDRAVVLARAARLTVGEARALTLADLADAYPPLAKGTAAFGRNHAAAQRHWAWDLSSRYCPSCLAGDSSPAQQALGGAWKLRWHLPVVFACLNHHSLLTSACPGCDTPANAHASGERLGLITQHSLANLHPAQCRQRPKGHSHPAWAKGTCGARLDQVPSRSGTLTAGDLRSLLALQQLIDRHLTPGSSSPGAPGSFFTDLVAAAHLITLSWPTGADLLGSPALAALVDLHVVASAAPTVPGRPGPGPGRTSRWAAPADSSLRGALLLAAKSLLGNDPADETALRDRVQPLAEAAFERIPANTAAAFRRWDFTPAMARAVARKTNGFYHAGGHRSSGLRLPSRADGFTSEEVPALLPTLWFDAHFAEVTRQLAPLGSWTARHLRRAASLKLVEMAAGGAWPDCAETLAIPWNTAQQSLKVLKRELSPGKLWPVFDHAVEAVAHDLDALADRVNYAERRRALAPWRLPDSDWAVLTQNLRLGCGASSPTGDTGTVLIWTVVTQGDHLHSPMTTALRAAQQSTQTLTASIAQLVTPANRKGSKIELLRRIDHYAEHLATTFDHGPIQPYPAETC